MVRQIYEGLGCPIDFADAHPPSGEDRFTVKVSSGAARATISVDDIGAQTVQRMGRARRELVERHALEVIYAELPLTDPATAPIATELEADGFGFLGLAPHASLRGDVLRLAYLVEPVDRAAIHVLEPVAGELLDYVLQEQQRVRANLL